MIIQKYKKNGSALIIAMLFVFILSALVLVVLERSALESRMVGYFSAKNMTLAVLEQTLASKEQELLKGKIPREAALISNRICGVTFYLLTLKNLQSTFAKVGDMSKCDPKPIIAEGRQSWVVID